MGADWWIVNDGVCRSGKAGGVCVGAVPTGRSGEVVGGGGSEQTERSNANAASVLANPFTDEKTAAEAFGWLRIAAKISEDIEKLDLKRNKHELWVNWTLAGAWKPKVAEQGVQTQASRLAKMTDAELGTDAFPILYVEFRTHGTESAEQMAAVQAAQRMAALFQKQFPVADPQAVKLYSDVIQPAVALADGLAAGKSPPAELDQFYAVVAEFISHYQRVTKWPFADRQAEIEKMTSAAIKLNPKVAKYYTTRGVARISLTPPNVDGALSDADAAVKLDA